MFELIPFDRKSNRLSYYNPFSVFEDFSRNFFANNTLGEFRTDIKDNGDSFQLETDLPGFKKEDIKIDIESDVLKISAERRSEFEEKDSKGKYLRCERSYGTYSRCFDVSSVKADAITASYENGVLTLNMPKKDNLIPASRHLEIE